MPIGPMGEPLPYNNGAPVGNPMGVQNQVPSGGNAMAAKQRLMEIAAEAEAIMTQFPQLAQELAGGGQNAQPAIPIPEMPQIPVQGNTGGMGGNIPPGLLTA